MTLGVHQNRLLPGEDGPDRSAGDIGRKSGLGLDGEIFFPALRSDTHSSFELRTLADTTVRRRLLAVEVYEVLLSTYRRSARMFTVSTATFYRWVASFSPAATALAAYLGQGHVQQLVATGGHPQQPYLEAWVGTTQLGLNVLSLPQGERALARGDGEGP